MQAVEKTCGEAARSPRQRRSSAALLAVGVALQGAALGWLAGWGAGASLLAAATGAALAAGAWRLWLGGAPSPRRDLMLVTGGIGGLGMMLGAAVDRWGPALTATAHHHAHGGSGLAPHLVGSWMGVGMLLFCVPGCALLCAPDRRRSPARRRLDLGLCTAGMIAGMVAGGGLLSLLAPPASAGFAAGHLAMLAGMVAGAGAAAALAAGRRSRRQGLRS